MATELCTDTHVAQPPLRMRYVCMKPRDKHAPPLYISAMHNYARADSEVYKAPYVYREMVILLVSSLS